jgi:periplasmic protein TonB
MHTPVRTAGIAAALTLALSAAAGAATVRLVPLSPATAGASITTCAVPSAPAAVTSAMPAELPDIAAGQNAGGVTEIRIAIDADGRLTDQSVLASSGNRWLDRAALRAARQSRYRAEVRDCAPVGGTYAFVVSFAP